MKKLKSIIVLVFAICQISYSLHGQETTANPTFKGAESFGVYAQWLMNAGCCAPVEYCKRFVGFVQFRLDKTGTVLFSTIKISDNIEGCLRDSLRDILISTSRQWEPMKENGQPVDSPELLQIIYFKLEGTCTVNDDYHSKDNLLDTFETAFAFEGESFSKKPVIILPLATIYSSAGTTDIGDLKPKN